MTKLKDITLFKLAEVLGLPVFFLSLLSFVYGFVVPDYRNRDAFCYADDAIIIYFKCKNEIISYILNYSHPLLNWTWAMFVPYYLPLIIVINLLAFFGFIKTIKIIDNLVDKYQARKNDQN